MTAFHLDHVINLAEYHVDRIPDHPDPLPAKWWIDTA
jgi:hypothetical protein